MITYVNIGPGQSGSTSFYNMCLEIKGINCGKTKEPLKNQINFEQDIWINNPMINPIDYFDNWVVEKDKDKILLDGSVLLFKFLNLKQFKEYSNNYVDDIKYIFLIRNPISYYTTRIFINNIIYSKVEILNKTNSFQKSIDTIENLDYISNFIQEFSISQHLRIIRTFLQKDKIFILPIEFFDDYKNELSEFLNIDFKNKLFHWYNKSENYSSSKQNLLKYIIKKNLKNNIFLRQLINKDLKEIDSIYNTKIFKYYGK